MPPAKHELKGNIINPSKTNSEYHKTQKSEFSYTKEKSQFNYPQGDDKQSSWFEKYSTESPFYLRKHITVRARYPNELRKHTALENARERYENSLKNNINQDKMHIQEVNKNTRNSDALK